MPPKVKNSKEEILATALEIARKEGEPGLNARSVAKALGCSTQPIYFNFGSMENLKKAISDSAYGLYEDFIQSEIAKGKYTPYEATQIAYIRFAKKETELFKFLFMSANVPNAEETAADLAHFAAMIHEETGISKKESVYFQRVPAIRTCC